MKNSKQDIFSSKDLRSMGFEREDAGGFYYFIKYLNEDDKVNCDALVTEDFDADRDETTIRFTVNLLKKAEDGVLNKAEIQYHIDERN